MPAPLPRLAALLVAVSLVLVACGGGSGTDATEAGSIDQAGSRTGAEPGEPADSAGPRPTSELAGLIQPAGSAATLPEADGGPMPVALSFEAIGASVAPVMPVGVEANGDMEIPGTSEVGWYQHGPAPGSSGSAVLAAHISWNGRDGVFRHLTRAEPGQQFTIGYDDGSIAAYEVVAVRQYPKDQLPDDLFATSGDPQVALITCGGSFNRALDSYDDNIVAYAVPV
ncbi:MAG: class F sortase [Acidimicrobiales bacterium]|nr:class F sortase [Acidimicrobiales bacterium]